MPDEMVTKWVNRLTPLYSDPKRKFKLCDIVAKSLVKTTGIIDGVYEQTLYVASGKSYTGWVHVDDLEPYVRNFATNVVKIEDQTPDPTDFEQYMMYQSIKQVNMCGELCVAYVAGVSLGDVLTKWKQKLPNMWSRFFAKRRPATGTNYTDLQEILSLFNLRSEPLITVLYQSHISRARYTQKNLNTLLRRGHVIMSVNISRTSGIIQATGILHWIVLLSILPERNGQGFVTFYNPAMNSVESSSWDTLLTSARSPYGVFIHDANKEYRNIDYDDITKGGN